jgi:hypothetical protein
MDGIHVIITKKDEFDRQNGERTTDCVGSYKHPLS